MSFDSIFRAGLFAGRVVVVTGGGSGIGRCIAHEVVALGGAVAIVGRDPEKLARVAGEIRAEGGKVSSHSCDIRDEDSVAKAVVAILEAHGRIDGLVNNAGGQFPAPLEKISAKGWDAVVRKQPLGGFLFARECYTQWMRDHEPGVRRDRPTSLPTCGTACRAWAIRERRGQACSTSPRRRRWNGAPLRINAIAPGVIASSGMDRYPPASIRDLAAASDIPLRRLGTESEISAAVLFLLSPAAAFVSGACLHIDGAAPNARRGWPDRWQRREATPAFNGFHLARNTEDLQGQ
jgi:citronellol/citronellal dehydrogenase